MSVWLPLLNIWPWIVLALAICTTAAVSEYKGRVPRVLRLLNTALIAATVIGFTRMML